MSNACRIVSRYGVSLHAVAPHTVNFCMSCECGDGQILVLVDELGDCVLVIVDISYFRHPRLGCHVSPPIFDLAKMRAQDLIYSMAVSVFDGTYACDG